MERAPASTVITLLFILCYAGAISGGEAPAYSSSAAAAKHREMVVRARKLKLLVNATAGGGVAAERAAAAALDECSESVVQVCQVNAGRLPNGIPTYSVTITNTCLGCTVRGVHVSCGNFASTELVDPNSFQRLAYADCLVKDGGPIGPGETVSFEYSNSFHFDLGIASVSCGGV